MPLTTWTTARPSLCTSPSVRIDPTNPFTFFSRECLADEEKGTAVFDFTGTGPEVYGNCNAPKAVAVSAILYCLRCLIKQEIPLNQVRISA